jgi:hypothetical protein
LFGRFEKSIVLSISESALNNEFNVNGGEVNHRKTYKDICSKNRNICLHIQYKGFFSHMKSFFARQIAIVFLL